MPASSRLNTQLATLNRPQLCTGYANASQPCCMCSLMHGMMRSDVDEEAHVVCKVHTAVPWRMHCWGRRPPVVLSARGPQQQLIGLLEAFEESY